VSANDDILVSSVLNDPDLGKWNPSVSIIREIHHSLLLDISYCFVANLSFGRLLCPFWLSYNYWFLSYRASVQLSSQSIQAYTSFHRRSSTMSGGLFFAVYMTVRWTFCIQTNDVNCNCHKLVIRTSH